jgi:hypothetical protein
MTDLKTEVEKGLDEFHAVTGKLETTAKTDVTWIKGHIVWMIGLGAYAAGIVTMFLLKH